jgi:hypothetical protein
MKRLEWTYKEAAERYGRGTADAQACMCGWESWLMQSVDAEGVRRVSCPIMGQMRVSKFYGHPMGESHAAYADHFAMREGLMK